MIPPPNPTQLSFLDIEFGLKNECNFHVLHISHMLRRKYATYQHSLQNQDGAWNLYMVKGNYDVSKGLFVFPENMGMGLVFVPTNGNKNNKKGKGQSKETQSKNNYLVSVSLIILQVFTINFLLNLIGKGTLMVRDLLL